MKKALSIILAVILVMVMAIPAYAAIVSCDHEHSGSRIVLWYDRDQLSPEKKAVFEAAFETIRDNWDDCLYFAYHENLDENPLCEDCWDMMWIFNHAHNEPTSHNPYDLVAKQYIDGKWVRLEIDVEETAVTTYKAVDAPVAFFRHNGGAGGGFGVVSPSAEGYQGRADNCDCRIILWDQRNLLNDEKREIYKSAKDSLRDAVPDEFVCRDFVYHSVEDNCTTCCLQLILEDAEGNRRVPRAKAACAVFDVDLSLQGVEKVIVKQFVDNKWVRRTIRWDEENILIYSVADGPFAIFTK